MVPTWDRINDKKMMYESGIAVKKIIARVEEEIKESRFRKECEKARMFLTEKALEEIVGKKS